MELNVNDIVKWKNPMEKMEREEVMLVKGVEGEDGSMLTLESLNGGNIIHTLSNNIRVVGKTCQTGIEMKYALVKKYINS